jgi:[NiFe] hydrogenase assembly HybE family chaperone
MDTRVNALVDFYRRVETERMQGIPILNPQLRVEAVGFRLAVAEQDGEAVAEGVLITPWFMSLVRLPLDRQDHAGRVARKAVRSFGNERFDFIGAHDPAVGYHEACALFSPMADFRSQAQARETAEAVLAQLWPQPQPAPQPAAVAEPVPARRSFFMARRAGAQGGAA